MQFPHVLRFDGVDDLVTVSGKPTALRMPSTGGAIGFWMSPFEFKTMGIVEFRGPSGTVGAFVLRTEGSSGAIRLIRWTGVSNNFESWETGASFLSRQERQHIVASFDGTDVTFYRNGIGVTPSKTSSNGGANDNDFKIGFDTGSEGSYFNGTIKNPRIWNRALTAEEVLNMYNTGGVPTNGLVASYTRISDDGTQLLDSVGGAHATITGAVRETNPFSIGPTPPRAIVPYVGAMRFDGVDDHVQMSADNYVVTDATWSFVCKPNAFANNGGLFTKYLGTGNQRSWAFNHASDSNGKLRVLMSLDGTAPNLDKDTIADVLSLNTLSFITIVKSGTEVHVYRDGVFVETLTGAPATLHQSTANMFVGFYAVTSKYFDGTITNTRIYNRALTTEEVEGLYLYNATKYDNNPTICRLNLELTAGQVVGSEWLDKSGNNNHGTITGAVVDTNPFNLPSTAPVGI